MKKLLKISMLCLVAMATGKAAAQGTSSNVASSVRSSVASIAVSSRPTTASRWVLDGVNSKFHFVTLKKSTTGVETGENMTFTQLQGTVAGNGQATLTIPLASLASGIDIRNTRMQSILFESNHLPSLHFTTQLDLSAIDGMAVGGMATVPVTGNLVLHGVVKIITFEAIVIKHAANNVSFSTRRPIVISSADFDMNAGVEALRTVAGLQAISENVPVYFSISLVGGPTDTPAIILPAAPNAPVSLVGSVSSGTGDATLNWSDVSANESGFLVRRKGADGRWVTEGNVLANTSTFVDSLLGAAGRHDYKVISYINSVPSSPTAPLTLEYIIGVSSASATSMASSTSTASSKPALPVGPSGYTFSTNEYSTVIVTGTMNIAYGANGKFVYLNGRTANVSCTNNAFGTDPIVGVLKSCFVQSVTPIGNAAQGKIHWENPTIGCLFCHAVNSDGTAGSSSKIDPKNLRFTTVANLVNYIEVNMPKGDPTACVGQCAADTAAYFLSLKPVIASSSISSSSIRSSTPVASSKPALSSVRSSIRSSTPVVSSTPVLSSVGSSVRSSVRSSTAVSSSTPALNGAALYVSKGCVNCHGARGDSPTRPIVLASWTRDTLIAKIATTMPANNPGDCAGACAVAVADYILTWRPVVSCTNGEDVLTRRLRLLTNYEYASTVNDLLNISTGNTIAAGFEADVKVKFFNNDVEAARMTNTRMDAYWNAADSLAKTVSLTNLLSCTGQTRDQCANTFVPAFGKKAFRRPLSAEEQTSYLNLFRLGTSNETGARLVIQAMLSSPGFLYRTELGSTLTGNTTLTPYEAASLLSYTFTGSMPDATLFTEADNNRLATSAQLRTQAERLLGTAKASAQLARFGTQWLKVDDVANLQRDRTLFPAFTPAIGAAMKSEMTSFLSEVFLKPGYKMADLFSPGFSYVNGPLATYYGMSGVSGDQFQKVPTNAQRGGVLHMGAVTATLSSMKESHPIHRGLLIRRNLLCQDFAPPPANIGEVEPLDPNKPTRERFAAHTNNTNCQSCHQYIDNIGFGFENYDAVGRFRTVEGNNLPVNATGNISGLITMSASDNFQFNDLRGLSNVLATSGAEATSKCLTKQYQRFATGISEPNECAVNASYSRWQAASPMPDLRTMMLETVTSPTFLTRK